MQKRAIALLVWTFIFVWVGRAQAYGRNPEKREKGSLTLEYAMGVGGCMGEGCERMTPNLAGDFGIGVYPHKNIVIIPSFSFALLGTDYSPKEKGYSEASASLLMPGVRLEIRHPVSRHCRVSILSGAGMAFYGRTGSKPDGTVDTIASDIGSYVQLGFAVKFVLFVVDLYAGMGGRLHTWGDQSGPLASYYIHGGFGVKFFGF